MPENYEFSTEQNSVFIDLRRNLRYFSLANIALGIATLVLAYLLAFHEDEAFAAISVLLMGALYCVLGVAWRRPMDNLQRIVETEGQDIDELMIAAGDLKKAFMVSTAIFVGFLLLRFVLSFGWLFTDTDLGQ